MAPWSKPAEGHTVSVRELQPYLNTALRTAPHNVLLFIQDKVSGVLIRYERETHTHTQLK